jgi:hypothetical protein
MREALHTQQFLLDLRVGQEQVGRATSAYLLGYRREEAEELDHTSPKSFFIFRTTGFIRSLCLDVVCSRWFSWTNMIVIIAASIVLAAFNIFDPQAESTRNRVLWILDDIFSVWFVVEIALKCVAHGVVHPYPTAYVYTKWNVFDGFIAAVSIASWCVPSLGLRYLKAFRVLHVFSFCRDNERFGRELRVVGFAIEDATAGLLSVAIFACLNYFVWASFALHLFGGTSYVCSDPNITRHASCVGFGNRTVWNTTTTSHVLANGTTLTSLLTTKIMVPFERQWYSPTNRTFDTFDRSLLTMLEVSTGTWWMDLLYQAADSGYVDVSASARQRPFLGLFLVAYYIVSGFVVLGLVSAQMVYSYVKCKTLMEGGVGLSQEQSHWLRVQRYLLDVRPDVLLVPLPNRASALLHRVVQSRGADVLVSCVVLANVITMAATTYGASSRNTVLLQCEYAWVAVFITESVARIAADGPRTLRYGPHVFDALTAVLSMVQLGLNSTATHRIPFDVNVLRMLRLFRVAHAIRFLPYVKRVRIYGQTLWRGLSSLMAITGVVCVCVYVFAVVGMHAFGGLPTGGYLDSEFSNYDTFVNSLLMTFRVATFESWSKVMRDALPTTRGGCSDTSTATLNCGSSWAPLYFAILLFFVGLLVMSLYAAVVAETYTTATYMEKSVKRLSDVFRFIDIWQQYDPQATMFIPTNDLHHVFRALRSPLGVTHGWDRVEITELCQAYHIPDHLGFVHFHEVLIPLARRALARDISDEDGAAQDAQWRATESSLSALPVIHHRSATATAEIHFAASFAGAAYRRKLAMRKAHDLRVQRWEDARRYCEEHHVMLAGQHVCGGLYALDQALPAMSPLPLILRCQREGLRPKTAALLNSEAPRRADGPGERPTPPAAVGRPPLSRPTSAAAAAAARPPSAPTPYPNGHGSPSPSPSPLPPRSASTTQERRSQLPEELRRGSRVKRVDDAITNSAEFQLSGPYRSVMDGVSANAFGPRTSQSIQRHETRSQKMERRRSSSARPNSAAADVQQTAAAAYQPPLGTQPEEWRAVDASRRRTSAVE